MRDTRIKDDERQWWKELFESADSAERRRELRGIFRKLFPNGHRDSIRQVVADCEKIARDESFTDRPDFKFLDAVHPDAFAIIAQYGTDYVPYCLRKRPAYGEPKPRHCYENSHELATMFNLALDERANEDLRRFVYVEGIAMGATVLPMAHAWVAYGLEGVKAMDWSFYATCRWVRYLGIPLKLEELLELRKMIRRTNIFSKQYFNPAVKKRLLEILDSRQPKQSVTRAA